jgi:uncharacterized coiled-coil DUF342 family protein
MYILVAWRIYLNEIAGIRNHRKKITQDCAMLMREKKVLSRSNNKQQKRAHLSATSIFQKIIFKQMNAFLQLCNRFQEAFHYIKTMKMPSSLFS